MFHSDPTTDSQSNYWLNTILINTNKTGVTPEDIRLHLQSLNVETRPLWKPMHLQPVYANAPAYVNGVSELLFTQGLCLPSGPWVTPDDVKMIVSEIKKCVND